MDDAVTLEVAVIEVLDGHGRVQARERVSLTPERRTFTVGRGTAADVILDDPYVAPLHVALEVTPEGVVRATDLGSVNGIIVGARRHRQAQGLELPDGQVQVGRTRLRVRTRAEHLPAERPDHAGGGDPDARRMAYGGALVCALFVGYYTWLTALWDPATVIAINLMKALPVAGTWIAIWALLSRVLTGEWRWLTHAAILFGVSAAVMAAGWLLDIAWFSFALPQWQWRDSLLAFSGMALLLYWHLMRVSTLRQRTVALIAVALPVLAIGATTWANLRDQSRNVNFIDAEVKLYPPALRLREGGALDAYFAAAAGLRETADRRRKAMRAGDDDTPEEE